MTPQQMIDFDARREAVLRDHMKTSPKFRAIRRDRRVAFAAGIVRYAAALGIFLFLIKAFVISQNGADAYLAMVAPLLAHLPEGGLLAQAVAPDAYSAILAATFADWTPGQAAAIVDPVDGVVQSQPAVTGS